MAKLEEPKISIITACYNSEKTIEQTIQSIIRQTYENIEYIIVDGASTDGTMDIVKKYEKDIDIVISEPDQGVYDAFNKGIKSSTGDIIYFLGSDDYFVSDSILDEVANVFINNPQIDIVYGQVIVIDEVLNMHHVIGRETNLHDLMKGLMLPHQGFFAKRELYLKYGCFDLQYKIVSDFDIVIQMFKDHHNNSLFIKKPIAYFRADGVSSNQYKVYREMDLITQKQFGNSYVTYYTLKDFNAPYYKEWLNMLLSGSGIGDILKKMNINKVAILGTMETTSYLIKDLHNARVEIVCLLDNNPLRINNKLNNYPIFSPNWILENSDQIDAVILSFEGTYEAQLFNQLDDLCKDKKLKVFSWRELLYLNV